MDTPQATPVSKNTGLAVLAYLGPLVIVSYLMGKDDPFVKFHTKQGLVLLVIEAVLYFIFSMWWTMWMLVNLVRLALLVLAVLGIVNVVQGKEKELPVVGGWSRYFSI